MLTRDSVAPLPPLVHELFLEALERGPDRIFVRRAAGGDEICSSYREVAAAIACTVGRLRALGIRRGDRAVVYAGAVVPSIHFMLSCAFAGVAFAPLAPAFSPEAVRRLQQRLDARVVFTTRDQVARLRAIGIRALHDGAGDDAGDDAGDEAALELSPPPRAGDLELLRACCEGRTSDEPYVILSTSGTTGEPKLPVRRHLAFTLPARHYREALEAGIAAEPRERLLLCSGLTHGLGQVVLALGLHTGAELCVPEAIEGAVSLEQVQRLDPSIVCVHPRVIQALHRQHLARGGEPRARFFGPRLRLLRTGGSTIDPELLQALAAQGIDVGEWYGSSETAVVAITPRGGWRPGEIGPVCPGVEVRLGPDGELLVRSPAQMTGYHGDEPLSRDAVTADGFILTGDLGALGAGGALRLVGRKKEILNAPDGTNIAAAPIEDLIVSLPWVEQAVLVGSGRPFLAALIAVRDAPPPCEADGFLSERAHPGLYGRARGDLDAINARLEAIEQIRSFALFGERFDARLYAEVGNGKIRRDRGGLDAAYRARIEALYAPRPRDGDRAALQELLQGAWITQAIYVAARLGIADLLGAEASPVDELARAARADPSSLYRLLRALSTIGIFSEEPGRRFALTPLAELLRRDHPDSVRNQALHRGMPETYAAWGALCSSVETGRPGFEQVFASARFDYFEAHPEAAEIFNGAMDDKTRRAAPAIAASYEFGAMRRLVDVGGGHGRLLGTILRAHPHLEGTLFDLPSVVAGARGVLDALEVTARVDLVGGDFFAEVPRADGYLLFNILHDWSDEDAGRILRTIARAMAPGARVLVVEMIVSPERNRRSPVAWMDLNMLVALGGRERTEDELRALAAGAGLRLARVVRTPAPYAILECVPALADSELRRSPSRRSRA